MGNAGGSHSPQNMLYTTEKKLIEDLIQNNCVVVFSKTNCIYCRKVKKVRVFSLLFVNLFRNNHLNVSL